MSAKTTTLNVKARSLVPFARYCVLSLLLPLYAVPSLRGEDGPTVNVELPCGALISIPSDWYPHKSEATLAKLKASGQKLFKPTESIHFRAHSDPQFTYAAVGINPALDGPGEEAVRNITPKELADYTREKKSELEAKYAKTGKSSLVSFDPIRRSTIAGHPALISDFSSLTPNPSGGGSRLRIRYIQLMVAMKLVEITLTYDEIATAMWKPVMTKIQDSIRYDPPGIKADPAKKTQTNKFTKETTFEIDGGTFKLPPHENLVRLDGASPEGDAFIKDGLGSKQGRMIAVFGQKEDHAILVKGKRPRLNRFLEMQVLDLEGRIMTKDDFRHFRDNIGKNEPTVPEMEDVLAEIAKTTADPAIILSKSPASLRESNRMSLGVYDGTEDYTMLSVLSPGRVDFAGKNIQAVLAYSSGIVNVRGRMLIVRATAVYSSPADLAWTRRVCFNYLKQLVAINPDIPPSRK